VTAADRYAALGRCVAAAQAWADRDTAAARSALVGMSVEDVISGMCTLAMALADNLANLTGMDTATILASLRNDLLVVEYGDHGPVDNS
jgi:hypothetical protein